MLQEWLQSSRIEVGNLLLQRFRIEASKRSRFRKWYFDILWKKSVKPIFLWSFYLKFMKTQFPEYR